MALRVGARDARVRALIALGFPLSTVGDTWFLNGGTQPRLFVQGEHDTFGPTEAIRALVDRLPEPRQLVVIPGADHFFTGKLDEMQQAVADWSATHPWEER
jgi:uncharacterized protein